MHNYNIAVKGEYAHKQTSDFLKVIRYIILRKKHTRYLLLDFENLNANLLTAVSLQIDQYDARGNSLGVVNVTYDGLNEKQGRFVLQQKIEMHRACVDFFVKIVYAEYGDVKYCLGDNDTYVVYDKKEVKKPLKKSAIKKEVGEEGHVATPRVFTAPKFIRFFSVIVLVAVIALTFFQLIKFKEEEESFFLSNVLYEFATNDRSEGADVIVTGYAGYGGGDLVIPASLEGYNVVKIQKDAFRDNNMVKTVKVEGDVIIENDAFAGCNNLRSVELNGVENIGENAFYNCVNLNSITIKDCLNIGAYAFENCNSVSTLNVYSSEANKTLNIGKHAFSNMGYISSVTINQYVNYGVELDYFYNTGIIDSLTLKNYNHAPFEQTGLVNKPLSALFGNTSYFEIKNLKINKVDTIPSEFTKDLGRHLETVEITSIEDGKIGDKAFNDCFVLNSFKSPEILEVGAYAFCNTLITKFDASQLSVLGEYAFSGCSELVDLGLSSNTLLKAIPKYAFRGTTKLPEIYFSEKIKEIGEGAFESSGIKKATFASTNGIADVESLGVNLFKNCTALNEVSLPKKLKGLPNSIFEGCSALLQVNIPSSVTAIGEKAFSGCSGVKSFVLPTELETLSTEAFSGCTSLTSFAIPDSVTEIGASVLKGCAEIISISTPFIGQKVDVVAPIGYLFGESNYFNQYSVLPTNLTSVKITEGEVIADGAFYNCHYLKTVDYPSVITEIGDNAFVNCYNLRFITLPKSLVTVGEEVFANCYKLFEVENYSSNITVNLGESGAGEFALAVYTSEDEPRMEKSIVDGFTFGKSGDKWYLMEDASTDYLTLPSSVNDSKFTIPKYFYYLTKANGLVLSEGVEEIGDNALKNTYLTKISVSGGDFALTEQALTLNEKLEEVDLTALNITEIPSFLLEGCYSLQKVSLPFSVVKICEGAFRNCTSLNSVVIPSTLQTIGAYAFEMCMALDVDLLNVSSLETIETGAFNNCYKISSISLPYGFETISEYAFYNCNGATAINLPSTLSKVGAYAFSGCNEVKEITTPFLGETPSSYGILGYYFGYMDNYSLPSSLTKVTVSDGDKLGASAFANAYHLADVNIPENLTEIPEFAFYNATALKTINFPIYLTNIGAYAFSYCSSLTEISLPYTLKTIGDCAFQNIAIQSFSAPNSLSSIGEYAFYGCYSLTDIYLNNVEEVKNYAFSNCSALKTANLGRVKTIGNYAFSSCGSLDTLNLGSAQKIGDYAFAYNGAIKKLVLPSTVKAIGYSAFESCYELAEATLSYGIPKTVDIKSSAFSYCNKLYQVYDLTYVLGVTVNSTNYGGIARNAIVVNTSASSAKLNTATVDGIVYKYAGNVCAIVDYEGYGDNITLNNVTLGGKTYNSYIIARYAFDSNYFNRVTIKQAVKEIRDGAFNYTQINELVFDGASLNLISNTFNSSVGTLIYDSSLLSIESNAIPYVSYVCYKGSESNWNYNTHRYNINSTYRPNYFYSDCIHSHNYGTVWNYDSNGYVNYASTPYDYRETLSPTCEEKGKAEYYCDKCNYLEKVTLEAIGHYYDDYVCVHCGEIYDVTVTDENYYSVLYSLINVTNDEVNPYDLFETKYNEIRSTNIDTESESKITIQAKRNLTLTFKTALSKTGVGSIIITANGKEQIYTSTTSKQYVFNLKANETVTIKFVRNDKVVSDGYAKITAIQIA